jgi:RHS repeat-associated protein
MRRIVLALLIAVSATPLLATDPIVLGPYQYDGTGNIRAIGPDESFLYDRDSRLVKAVMTPGAQTFTYDLFGNRTSTDTSGITRCNGGADCARRPDPTIKPRTNRFEEATYNAAGAVATFDGHTYTYDSIGMMTSQHNTQLVQYVYTADDERIAVYTGTRWEWSLRDPGAHVIRQVTSDDATSASASTNWTWTDDQVFRAGSMLASERSIGRRHFHLDHLGTPRLITTDTGAVAAQYEYYAFGPQPDTTVPPEIPTEELKFTGHQRDLAAGDVHVLDYMHARYYDGAVGRFLAVDPASTWDLDRPQTFNLYEYAGNNPVHYVDDDGKEKLSFFVKILAKDTWREVEEKVAMRLAKSAEKHAVRVEGPGSSRAAKRIARLANEGEEIVRHDAHIPDGEPHWQPKKRKGGQVGYTVYGAVITILGFVPYIGNFVDADEIGVGRDANPNVEAAAKGIYNASYQELTPEERADVLKKVKSKQDDDKKKKDEPAKNEICRDCPHEIFGIPIQ